MDDREKSTEFTNINHDTEANRTIEPNPNVPDQKNAGVPQTETTEIVTWDGPDDPAKPVNWPTWRRWTIISLVTAAVFCAGISSSMFAPSVPQLMEEFGSSNQVLGTLVVSIYVLGLAFGPVFFAPLSELYGRLPIQHIGNVGFLLFTIACGLATDLNMLIGFRLVQGVFATVPVTNGGGVIADTVKQEERGFVLSMFIFGLLSGPVVGPVIGGFLTLKGWRWSFWLSAIMIALPLLLCIPFYRETYPPILLARKASKLRKETGNTMYRSEYDRGESGVEHFKRGIGRAVKMLIFSPVVLALSIYTGLVYSYFYLLVTTLTPVFQDVYHFKTTIVGLAYLGLGVGYLLGQFVFAKLSDRIVKHRAKKYPDGQLKPEDRLVLATYGGLSVPIAFFWYGWAVEAKVHWIVPIIGPAFMGLGNSMIFVSECPCGSYVSRANGNSWRFKLIPLMPLPCMPHQRWQRMQLHEALWPVSYHLQHPRCMRH